MDVAIIGGMTHLGSHLVSGLKKAGMDVIAITASREVSDNGSILDGVRILQEKYHRRSKKWYSFLSDLDADVCIDLIGTDLPGTYQGLKNRIQHFLTVGDFRMYGRPYIIPTPEEMQGQCEFGDMALQFKEMVGVQHQSQHDGIAFTAFMTPPVIGPGVIPLDCQGGRDLSVHQDVAAGRTVILPAGCQSLIAPVDVDDVVRGIIAALQEREKVSGEIYNIGPPYAISMEKLIQEYALLFQEDIPVEYVSWDKYFTEINSDPDTNYYFRSHIVPDIAKIRTQLGFEPHYVPEESLARGVEWMLNQREWRISSAG